MIPDLANIILEEPITLEELEHAIRKGEKTNRQEKMECAMNYTRRFGRVRNKIYWML
jgi:hypothetical protein